MERTAGPGRARPLPSEIVGRHEPAVRLSCPARASSSLPLDGTRQRDRPCTQAVYPQHLRDSSLVQTAFAPSLASKYRSISYSNSTPAETPKSTPVWELAL